MTRLAIVLILLASPLASAQKPDGSPVSRFIKEADKYGGFFITATGSVDAKTIKVLFCLAHTDETRRLPYHSWNSSGTAKLSDDLGNVYALAGGKPPGQIQGTVLVYSDMQQYDVVRFERPVPKASVLTLELSGKNIGHEGTVRLTLKPSPGGFWKTEKAADKKKK